MVDSRPLDETPLTHLDDWDDDVRRRYPRKPAEKNQSHEFRNYEEGTRDGVREFYRRNHVHQTVDFVRSMHVNGQGMGMKAVALSSNGFFLFRPSCCGGFGVGWVSQLTP